MTEAIKHHPVQTSAALSVDEEDPFFFDHPLDHVPAMLLLDTCLHNAVRSTSDGMRVRSAKFRFRRFCEKDLPTAVTVSSAGPNPLSHEVSVTQNDTVVCEGEITLVPGEEMSWPLLRADARRADKHLVHKLVDDRVLVGPIQRNDGGHTVAVGGPVVRAGRPGLHPVSPLVEAARQAGIMTLHEVSEVPVGWQFVVTKLQVDLVAGGERRGATTLRYGTWRLSGQVFVLPAEIMAGGRVVGTISFSGRVMPLSDYHQLRPEAIGANR
ncbi:AfsA-related hotdog domain-containing protein [Lentzea sp. NPDC034063]|uniref:AfsA-related hotdog domain-containing protein n=1 Tax=unclassified Lentzea TaxID=2643253 RepID=UPI0033EB54D8